MTHFYYLSGEILEHQPPHEGVARTRSRRRFRQEGLLQGNSGGGGITTARLAGGDVDLLGDGLQRINLDPAV
jgi:hypothetical protein